MQTQKRYAISWWYDPMSKLNHRFEILKPFPYATAACGVVVDFRLTTSDRNKPKCRECLRLTNKRS